MGTIILRNAEDDNSDLVFSLVVDHLEQKHSYFH